MFDIVKLALICRAVPRGGGADLCVLQLCGQRENRFSGAGLSGVCLDARVYGSKNFIEIFSPEYTTKYATRKVLNKYEL